MRKVRTWEGRRDRREKSGKNKSGTETDNGREIESFSNL